MAPTKVNPIQPPPPLLSKAGSQWIGTVSRQMGEGFKGEAAVAGGRATISVRKGTEGEGRMRIKSEHQVSSFGQWGWYYSVSSSKRRAWICMRLCLCGSGGSGSVSSTLKSDRRTKRPDGWAHVYPFKSALLPVSLLWRRRRQKEEWRRILMCRWRHTYLSAQQTVNRIIRQKGWSRRRRWLRQQVEDEGGVYYGKRRKI